MSQGKKPHNSGHDAWSVYVTAYDPDWRIPPSDPSPRRGRSRGRDDAPVEARPADFQERNYRISGPQRDRVVGQRRADAVASRLPMRDDLSWDRHQREAAAPSGPPPAPPVPPPRAGRAEPAAAASRAVGSPSAQPSNGTVSTSSAAPASRGERRRSMTGRPPSGVERRRRTPRPSLRPSRELEEAVAQAAKLEKPQETSAGVDIASVPRHDLQRELQRAVEEASRLSGPTARAAAAAAANQEALPGPVAPASRRDAEVEALAVPDLLDESEFEQLPRWFRDDGLELLRQRAFGRAVDFYADVAEDSPKKGHGWLGLGVALLGAGQMAQAARALTKGRDLDKKFPLALLVRLIIPDFVDAWYDLAGALVAQRKSAAYEAACDLLELVVEASQTSPLMRARARTALDQIGTALEEQSSRPSHRMKALVLPQRAGARPAEPKGLLARLLARLFA
jgi:tetratricopeptide (TPR) repeat protein